MDFKIELRPHVGIRVEDGVEVRVEHDQYMIFVAGDDLEKVRGKKAEHIGYVGKAPGLPINYLKVAAAFGEATVKVFNQMIRVALVEKARERIEVARRAAEEAEQLREESSSLLSDGAVSPGESAAAEDAVKIAEDAIAEANKELAEASALTDSEASVDRQANEPTRFYAGNEDTAETLPAANGTESDLTEADLQNL